MNALPRGWRVAGDGCRLGLHSIAVTTSHRLSLTRWKWECSPAAPEASRHNRLSRHNRPPHLHPTTVYHYLYFIPYNAYVPIRSWIHSILQQPCNLYQKSCLIQSILNKSGFLLISILLSTLATIIINSLQILNNNYNRTSRMWRYSD